MADFNGSSSSFYTSNPKVWIWGNWSTTRAVSGNKAGWNVTINLWANRTSGYTTYGSGEVQIEINGKWYKETKYISLSGTAQKLMTKTVFVEGELDEDSTLSGMGVYINIYDVLTCTGNFGVKAKRNKYYVYYYGNGNTDGQGNWWEKVLYGLPYKVQPNWYERQGYSFKVWNTDKNGNGVDWSKENTDDAGYKWFRELDVYLYAQWSPNTYAINYVPNGAEGSEKSINVVYDTFYALSGSIFVRDGYTFVGWNESEDGTGTDWTDKVGSAVKWNVARNLTLYAQWKPNSYKIIYSSNDERNLQVEQNVLYGSNYTLKGESYPKIGHLFVGWNDSPDGTGKDYTSEIGQVLEWNRTKNLILYAQWKSISNVFIRLNGVYELGTMYQRVLGDYGTGKLNKRENGIYRP